MKTRLLIGILPLLLVITSAAQTSTQPGVTLTADSVPYLFPLTGQMRWTGGRLAGCDYCASKPILWAVDR